MKPEVTIIIPIRNEEIYISKCIESILSSECTYIIEIIIIDGMSTDGTRTIVQELQKKYPKIILLDNPGRIVATGINKAVIEARGDVIIRIDGHTTISEDYIYHCLHALKFSGAENVGGRMVAKGTTKFGAVVAVATSTPFGVGDSRFHYSTKEEWVDSVYMGAWPKEVFDRVGSFD